MQYDDYNCIKIAFETVYTQVLNWLYTNNRWV